jgi:hypothetical protein
MTGNPALTRQLKASLQRLANGLGGPVLAEMARDVLDGRISLRDVTRSYAYADAMATVMDGYRKWHVQLSDRERQQLFENTEAELRDESDVSRRSAATDP